MKRAPSLSFTALVSSRLAFAEPRRSPGHQLEPLRFQAKPQIILHWTEPSIAKNVGPGFRDVQHKRTQVSSAPPKPVPIRSRLDSQRGASRGDRKPRNRTVSFTTPLRCVVRGANRRSMRDGGVTKAIRNPPNKATVHHTVSSSPDSQISASFVIRGISKRAAVPAIRQSKGSMNGSQRASSTSCHPSTAMEKP